MPTGNLPPAGEKMHKRVYDAALAGQCKGDEQCAAKIAWAAVEKKYKKVGENWVLRSDLSITDDVIIRSLADVNYVEDSFGVNSCSQCQSFSDGACDRMTNVDNPSAHCDLFEETTLSGNLGTVMMSLTKAPFDKETGEKRWAATTSDTEKDLYTTRMSLSLFKDFLARIESNEAPPVTDLSDYYKGGLPYLSLSHYKDLDGFATLGRSRAVYVDGDRLKAKGVFENPVFPELADAAWNAIRSDIAGGVPPDNRIRISIRFLDWQHTHDDFVFVREALTDKCPYCLAGIPPTEFQKGQLIHFALTRSPVNQRTSIELEERSMKKKTQLEDATSIVGEDLADKVHERAQQGTAEVVQSTAIVDKADVGVLEKRSSGPWGGALTLASAHDFRNAQKMMWKLDDLWYIIRDVIYNILDAPEELVPSKTAAVEGILAEAKSMMESTALVALARLAETPQPQQLQLPKEESQMAHVLDETFEKLRAAYDNTVSDSQMTRKQKYDAIQPVMNDLGSMISRSVDGTTPFASEDIQEMVKIGVQEALQPFLQSLAGAQAGQARSASVSPSPRQVQLGAAPTAVPTDASAAVSRSNTLHDMIRRSVGLQPDGGAK